MKDTLSEEDLLGTRRKGKYIGITASFIENQSLEWLHQFYRWLSMARRMQSVRTKPIFLDNNGYAAPAFGENNEPLLYLPAKDIVGWRTVDPVLLQNQETRKFIESMGIQTPSVRDHIIHHILPLYKAEDNTEIVEHSEKYDDLETHFRLIFNYFCKKCLSGEDSSFFQHLRDCKFLMYREEGSDRIGINHGESLYFPTLELKKFFAPKQEIQFILYEKYCELAGSAKQEQLDLFLKKLGVSKYPKTYPVCTDKSFYPFYVGVEKEIEGLQEQIRYVRKHKKKEGSFFLWDQLCGMVNRGDLTEKDLKNYRTGSAIENYQFGTPHESSRLADSLQGMRWIVNTQGHFVNAKTVNKSSLHKQYDLDQEGASRLISLLGIEDDIAAERKRKNLTEREMDDLLFGAMARKAGLTMKDLEELIRKREEEELQRSQNYAGFRFDMGSGKGSPSQQTSFSNSSWPWQNRAAEGYEDADPYRKESEPAGSDYTRQKRRAQTRATNEMDRIDLKEQLEQQAQNFPRYSFGWMKPLLELEILHSQQANSSRKEISISFSKVEREPDTQRTLILKHPSRSIPSFIEELSDIPLTLYTEDREKLVIIEAANIQSYTLRVKLKSSEDLQKVDFSTLRGASLRAQSPVFLLEELQKQFVALDYPDDFNMQMELCSNIEFIFGPPGTGKTTYLARDIIVPMMRTRRTCKILVLAPTNKAADVLTRKIMDSSHSSFSYENWLIRFGATADEEIEQSCVFREKNFDICSLPKSVTVTTIARFPYDYFMATGTRLFLKDIDWDCIIIDEASMIPLINIVYPLYKKKPEKFIIAGDPFQIEPIVQEKLWKGENIYSMVKLDSFANPLTVPRPYKIIPLQTQYRSVPEIGELFSRFTYDGILKHFRSSQSRRLLNLPEEIQIQPLNLIRFPVSRYESIYRPKTLHSSSYQIYSALFTYEYVCWLSKAIARANPGSNFRIGIISPYRIQADLIDKLIAGESLPVEVEVQASTIHGFQGDECDIIFAVLNTPPSLTSNSFVNNQKILNVSISRARDYLFVILPDEKASNLVLPERIHKIEALIQKSSTWQELFTQDLEQQLFGSADYLETNVFSTSHQSVNVYGLPEKYYEVRTEDTAVDIQIYREAFSDPGSSGFSHSVVPDRLSPVRSLHSVSSVAQWTEKQKRIQKRKQAEGERLAQIQKQIEEQKRIEEARIAEEKRRREEQRQIEKERREEEQRQKEAQRRAQEQKRIEARQRLEEEKRMQAQRRAEEQRQLEERRLAEEQKRLEEEKLAEKRRQIEEQERQEEQKRLAVQREKNAASFMDIQKQIMRSRHARVKKQDEVRRKKQMEQNRPGWTSQRPPDQSRTPSATVYGDVKKEQQKRPAQIGKRKSSLKSGLNQEKIRGEGLDNIPVNALKKAIIIKVCGVRKGKYYLVPYSGKLSQYTKQKGRPIYIKLKNYQYTTATKIKVTVDEVNRIIYIPIFSFKEYEGKLISGELLTLANK